MIIQTSMIDTHAHIYSEEFDADREKVIERALKRGIEHIILPNIDLQSLQPMLQLEASHPDICHAAIGLHPVSVKENFAETLNFLKFKLQQHNYIAIGEIGIDLYWDKTYQNEQIEAFCQQIEWALEWELPVIIHVRDSFKETMQALEPYRNKKLRGVFHSFTGTIEEANQIITFGGFKIGINGILTFKNSELSKTVSQIETEYLVLETDAPYLSPVPFRGKRNEPAYLSYICEQLALILGKTSEEVEFITTQNAKKLFKLQP
ncbi:MAG TPA: TatD family hydrolase [Paludibacteraceae bacterium]|nr:TatD family hydrolase [Paludibacteraceae bacterium]HOR38554.1 TatD family hydrolase [Paludibacteraceae bacterium]